MKQKKLVLVGAGGLCREVFWQLDEIGEIYTQYNIVGVIDDYNMSVGVKNLPFLGDDQWLIGYQNDINAVICVGNVIKRKEIYLKLHKKDNICFPTIIADGVKYSDSVIFGQGCIICLSNIFTVDISIGSFVIINPNCTICHDVKIGDFVTLSPGVNIAGNVCIGSNSEIGIGSSVIQGVNIGKNVKIGAGSIVVRDIPDNCTAVGIPAKPIKFH